MNNIFPLQENVSIEEVYGYKRKNAYPPSKSKTFVFGKEIKKKSFIYYESFTYDWLKKEEVSDYERNTFSFLIPTNETSQGINKCIPENEYLRIRNTIINLYEEKKSLLSLSEAFLEVNGSFDLLAKIFSFLEGQKIINNRNLIKECKIDLENVQNNEFNESNESSNLKAIIYEEISQEGFLRHECRCTKTATYFSKDKEYVCKECFSRGIYSSDLSGSDFLRLDQDLIKKVWTKKEEIRLLEAIDQFGDDWKKVSDHVRTKSIHDCVMYFISIPIKENNIKKLDFSCTLPFAKTPNPIMYLITFMSSVVHPSLGSIAAQEAMRGIESNPVDLIREILIKLKTKAGELIVLENEKIKRTVLILEEALLNIVGLKTKTYKDLVLSEEKVRQELTELRNRMLVEELE